MENSEDSCSVLTLKSTTHLAALQNGKIVYIEVPLTTEHLYHYPIIDKITLIPSVVQIYHPAIIEQLDVHFQDIKQTNSSFEANHIDVYRDQLTKTTLCKSTSFSKVSSTSVSNFIKLQRKFTISEGISFSIQKPNKFIIFPVPQTSL